LKLNSMIDFKQTIFQSLKKTMKNLTTLLTHLPGN